MHKFYGVMNDYVTIQFSFTYNADGIRTSKTVNGVKTTYYLDGNRIIAEETNSNLIIYVYDAQGAPIGFQYHGASYSMGSFDVYWYEKNMQGDITAVYNSYGTKLVSYAYDAYGNFTKTLSSGVSSTSVAAKNPFTYRGYYYDYDLELYYVASRYYDSDTGRWINVDNQIAGVGGEVLGYNMFAYCMNNPVNMSDPSGNWPKWIETATNWVNNNIIQPVKNFFSSPKQSNVVNASSHDANRRPYNGEPGSTYTAPNGDSRTYGPDGTPEHDYDHDDHGRPDKHPHDPNGGHNHDWENGVRGPAYSVGWEPLAGAALVTVCVIGIVVVAADNATGIGVADDFLFGPLGAGVGEGLILIFGQFGKGSIYVGNNQY